MRSRRETSFLFCSMACITSSTTPVALIIFGDWNRILMLLDDLFKEEEEEEEVEKEDKAREEFNVLANIFVFVCLYVLCVYVSRVKVKTK